MLKVIIEYWPCGCKDARQVIGVMDICNDGTGTKESGNYTAKIYKITEPTLVCLNDGTAWKRVDAPKVWMHGSVIKFPRQSDEIGVWDLLRSALNNTLGSRPTWKARRRG